MVDRNVDIVQSERNATVYLPSEAMDLTGYPVKDGWFEEGFNNDLTDSDPTVAWPGIEFWTGTIGDRTQEWRFPERFKAVHCSLIPKGVHRGKLLLWDGEPVVAKCPATGGTNWWSWQSFVILDLSPNATIRCRNFILPISEVIDFEGHNYFTALFCAGHAWTEHGDLVIAGGNVWKDNFQAYAYGGVWVWNPAQVAAATSLPGSPPTYVNINVGHYQGFGAWVYHGLMKRNRWYASVKTTPRYARAPYSGTKTGVLILGGSFDPTVYYADPSWQNYEALVVNSSPSCAAGVGNVVSGLAQDSHSNPGYQEEPGLWYGPAVGIPSPNVATALALSLIYYPHMWQMSNGSFYMAGMAQVPATLADHGASPGLWTTGPGEEPSPSWGRERMYASSVRAPNHIASLDDYVIIIGGTNYTPVSGVNESTDSAQIIDATNNSAVWVDLPDLNYGTTEQNLVVTPDADLYLFGGADKEQGPNENGEPVFGADLHTKVQRLRADPTSPTGYAQDQKWELITWSPAESYRNYHSTIMLMPDGRIFTGGGDAYATAINPAEPSHAHNPTASDHPGYDYEIFYPRYLRPTETPSVTFPRPVITGFSVSIVSGAYPVNYATSYTVTCAEPAAFRSLSHVVLMAPGSRTHHIDFSENYHKPATQSVTSRTTISFTMPASDSVIPRGFYMLFVLDDNRVPSEAIWIKV